MKAREVLQLYAKGERDFRRVNLRGQSFKEKDLSGADFSEADIRGTNFAKATLVGTCFREAQAGHQWYSKICWSLFLVISLLFLLGLIRSQFTEMYQRIVNAIELPGYQIILTLLFIALLLLIFGFVFYVYWDPDEERKDKRIISLRTNLGGTNFQGANLTKASFSGATVSHTNFTNAILSLVNWKEAKRLEQTISKGTYLVEERARQLLTTLDGRNCDFDQLNLQGVNLQGANLQGASLIQANLNEASLQGADLTDARLVQALLDRADLTGATLTGAYLEDWSITTETQLKGIRCDYVFMRLPPDKRPVFMALPLKESRDPNPRRKPDDWNKNFEEGEFAEFIKPMRLTLDLYHNKPVDLRLVALAFRRLQENNSEAEIEAISIEKKGQNRDKLLIRAETSPKADRSALHSEYFADVGYLESLSPEQQAALLRERGEVMRFLLANQKPPGVFINDNSKTSLTQGDNQMTGDRAIRYHQDNRDLRGSSGDIIENIEGDNIKYDSQSHQNLAEAAAEIQQLLEQLAQTYPTETLIQQAEVAERAIARIEGDPTWKQRAIAAIKAIGVEAFMELIDHPVANVLRAGVEKWNEPN